MIKLIKRLWCKHKQTTMTYTYKKGQSVSKSVLIYCNHCGKRVLLKDVPVERLENKYFQENNF